jgi:dihydroorotate dehydrogenase
MNQAFEPFYNPNLTYEENYELGPGSLAEVKYSGDLRLPFGIPAGPLLNGEFCKAAFSAGYDIAVYKTVRSKNWPCNAFPNVLYVHPDGRDLTFKQADNGVLTDSNRPDSLEQLNISNSFGVPSFDPDVWQPDMALAVQAASHGQQLVGSFQGSGTIQSFVDAARLVAQTGVKTLELNTSCPNEGKDNLLCFDFELVGEITSAIKEEIGDLSLFIKIAYLRDGTSEEISQNLVNSLIKNTIERGVVQGISAINTIPTKLVNTFGEPALPGLGRESSGVCGAGIKWAGLEMTKALSKKRDELLEKGVINSRDQFKIAGVGGVQNAADYLQYIEAGADEVLAATAPMFDPEVAIKIKNALAKGN